MKSEITIVSGLPRSGTSLMMQMLRGGGMEIVTDEKRLPDDDNPRGYLEFEPVKKLKQDTSWLPTIRGKAIKLISQLLVDLPPSENYAIVWMDRDLEEVLASQSKMLERLGQPGADPRILREGFRRHLARVEVWLAACNNIRKLSVPYARLITSPEIYATQINEFLSGGLDTAAMCSAVDPALYRNRKNA